MPNEDKEKEKKKVGRKTNEERARLALEKQNAEQPKKTVSSIMETKEPPVAKQPPSTEGILMDEAGSTGLHIYSGMIAETWNAELRWPQAWIIYERIRRTDPEMTVVRQIFSALVRSVKINVKLHKNSTDDDKRFQEFMYQCLDDMEGGIVDFLSDCVSTVPFFGWGWWEAPACIRNPDWNPPIETEWRSSYKDNLIGIRKLAYRHPSRFERWDVEPPVGEQPSGRVKGLYQVTDYGEKYMRLKDSVHIKFGDTFNPEGLATLEAVYRLERIKYALEIIQGIGFEHSAGHVKFSSKQKLTNEDKTHIKAAARAVTTAQEGNYLALPEHINAELIDVAFTSATTILEAIRYYSMLKLQVFNMQFVAMSTTSGAGSYAALGDSSSTFMVTFSSMIAGFISQYDKQVGNRLYKWNKQYFPGMSRRPNYEALPLEKSVNLTELGKFVTDLFGMIEITSEDIQAIRKKSGFLPELSSDDSIKDKEDQRDISDDSPLSVNKTVNKKEESNSENMDKAGNTISWEVVQQTEKAMSGAPESSGLYLQYDKNKTIELGYSVLDQFLLDRNSSLMMQR